MEYVNAIFGFIGVLVGSGITIVIELIRNRAAAAQRDEDRSERETQFLASLYTDFLVAFQVALKLNEDFYAGMAWMFEGRGDYKEKGDHFNARIAAEQQFREAVWRVRVAERDAKQRRALEEMANAFEYGDDETDIQGAAFDYPGVAKKLRESAIEIVDRFQITLPR